MSKKRMPRIITGAVVTTIAAAAILTFTRGDSPQTDIASTLLPGVSDTAGPRVDGSTPTPTAPASADAAERDAKAAQSKTATPANAPIKSSSTQSPKTSPPKDPDPTPQPPAPTQDDPCDLLSAILGGCK